MTEAVKAVLSRLSNRFTQTLFVITQLLFLYVFVSASDTIKMEMIHAVPIVIATVCSGAGVVLTAYGLYQNRVLMANHRQLTKTVVEESGRVAQVAVRKADQTQEKVEEVHQLVNGGPEGIGAQLKIIIADALNEISAQQEERLKNAEERIKANTERIAATKFRNKETDPALPIHKEGDT